MREVTDPAILKKLEKHGVETSGGLIEITDPVLLDKLETSAIKPKVEEPKTLGSTPPKLGFWGNLAKAGTSSLPAVGAVVGSAPGVIGTPFTGGASLPLAVAGAAGGAGIGASVQKLIEQNFGLSEPETAGQQYTDIGKEMVYGGLSPAGGSIGAKTSIGILGNKLSPTMQGINAVAKEAGIAPTISMLRPESKTASLIENILGKVPLASLLQRGQLNKIVNKTGEFATEAKKDIFDVSITAARKQQGQVYQQAVDLLPERLPMPKTVEYVGKLLKADSVNDLISSIKNNPDLANVSPETMDEIIKTAVKNFKPSELGKDAMVALKAFMGSVDETGTVSREMLGTFKSNLAKAKVGTVAKKELNRIMQSEMPEEAAKMWMEADKQYAYLGKLKPVEDIFKFSFSNKEGYKKFNPATFVEKYGQAVENEQIPSTFKPVMDKLKALAELSTKSAQQKAEFTPVMEIAWGLIGAGGTALSSLGIGTTPAIAMALTALGLARSSTAKRGIIRKLATSGVMSKEASEVLGELAGRYSTVGMAGNNTTKQISE